MTQFNKHMSKFKLVKGCSKWNQQYNNRESITLNMNHILLRRYSFNCTKKGSGVYHGRTRHLCYIKMKHGEFSPLFFSSIGKLILTYQKHLLLAPSRHLPVVSSLLTSLPVVPQEWALLAVIQQMQQNQIISDDRKDNCCVYYIQTIKIRKG